MCILGELFSCRVSVISWHSCRNGYVAMAANNQVHSADIAVISVIFDDIFVLFCLHHLQHLLNSLHLCISLFCFSSFFSVITTHWSKRLHFCRTVQPSQTLRLRRSIMKVASHQMTLKQQLSQQSSAVEFSPAQNLPTCELHTAASNL